MLYRRMPGTGERVSVLGFGAMRLPLLDEKDPGSIDRPEAIAMIRRAVDGGVNVVDTAWPYHGGESERLVGEALKGGYREKVFLSTKLPTYEVEKHEDMDRFLDEQRKRLQSETIDFYLLHALNRERWARMQEHGFASFLERALEAGTIRHAGFSFHADREIFKEIVDAYDWSFCLIMYNLLDEHFQAGREGMLHAAEKGLGIMVMEPLRGGRLAGEVPDPVQRIWDEADVRRSPAAWGLRWVWDHPEVSVALSGMSTMAQVEENLRVASEGRAGSLTEAERSLAARVKAEYRKRIRVDCTTCGYCLPCPEGVNITGCFSFLNNAFLFDAMERYRDFYRQVVPDAERASRCVECGSCEEACPQGIPIREKLKEVAEHFEAEGE